MFLGLGLKIVWDKSGHLLYDNEAPVHVINSDASKSSGDRFMHSCLKEILFCVALHELEIKAMHCIAWGLLLEWLIDCQGGEPSNRNLRVCGSRV